jgi:hypothetical protein
MTSNEYAVSGLSRVLQPPHKAEQEHACRLIPSPTAHELPPRTSIAAAHPSCKVLSLNHIDIVPGVEDRALVVDQHAESTLDGSEPGVKQRRCQRASS